MKLISIIFTHRYYQMEGQPDTKGNNEHGQRNRYINYENRNELDVSQLCTKKYKLQVRKFESLSKRCLRRRHNNRMLRDFRKNEQNLLLKKKQKQLTKNK